MAAAPRDRQTDGLRRIAVSLNAPYGGGGIIRAYIGLTAKYKTSPLYDTIRDAILTCARKPT